MKEYVVSGTEEGQTLLKYVSKILKNAPSGVIYKALRKKNIDSCRIYVLLIEET